MNQENENNEVSDSESDTIIIDTITKQMEQVIELPEK
jgi:hypothetical protein